MTMAYENIQKALGTGNALSAQQQADNYDMFGRMMKEGVYLPDIVKKIDALESEVKEMRKPKESAMDAQLFAVMEQSVRDDPEVVTARRKLQDEKTRIISELCMSKEGYRKLFDEYRTAVNAAYVAKKES